MCRTARHIPFLTESKMAHPLPASRESSWHIASQGFQSKNLFLDISPNGDGFVVTFKSPHDVYKLFFAPTGQITHVRHYDAETSAEHVHMAKPQCLSSPGSR